MLRNKTVHCMTKEETPPGRVLVLAFFHGLGHLVRCIAIAKELQRLGHAVLFACSERAIQTPRNAGLVCRTIQELPPFSPTALDTDRSTVKKKKSRLANVDYLSTSLKEEEALIRDFKPTLIIFDFRITGGVSAALAVIPSISIFNAGFFVHPFPEIWPQVTETLAEIGVPKEAREKLLGDIMVIADFSRFDPLSAIPSSMLGRIFSTVREIRYVGPLLRYTPAHLPSKTEIRGSLKCTDVPLIFVTFGGTAFGLRALKSTLRELRGIAAHCIIITGPHIPTELVEKEIRELRNSTHSKTTVYQYTDDSLLYMKAAHAAIIHGGHTTVMEGILCGTPLLCVPLQLEQVKNSQRITSLKVGHVIDPHDIPARMGGTLQRVLSDTTLRRRCERVAHTLGRLNGAAELARFIEINVFNQFI